jgi:hypothetical protein
MGFECASDSVAGPEKRLARLEERVPFAFEGIFAGQ